MELITRQVDPLITEACAVCVIGLAPSESVQVEVACDYGPGPGGIPRVWTARASFVADMHGSVDLAADGPAAGDWVGDTGGRGPWWSASLGTGTSGTRYASDHVPTQISATTDTATASVGLTRRRVARPTRQRNEEWSRCRTRTYLPHRDIDLRAGLIVVGGSDGGMPYDTGWSLLASTGVAVTTVEYFGPPGLPGELDLIPGLLTRRDHYCAAVGPIRARRRCRRG